MPTIVTTIASTKKNKDENPEGRRKNSINAFVTADPVAAGKRQEANSRSAVQRRLRKKKSGREGVFIYTSKTGYGLLALRKNGTCEEPYFAHQREEDDCDRE